MKPRNREILMNLNTWTDQALIRFNGMKRQLRNKSNELPSAYADIHAAVDTCLESIERLSAQVEALFDFDKKEIARWFNRELIDSEICPLLALNRRLKEVECHLRSVAENVTPRLEAKLADPDDRMIDYDIEAIIYYVLREDDPEFDENNDNFLTSRTESIKYLTKQERLQQAPNFADTLGPERLLAEPHSWLFHDLYDHEYGNASPRVPLHNCLRIGKIYVDVQISQEYEFDVAAQLLFCKNFQAIPSGWKSQSFRLR